MSCLWPSISLQPPHSGITPAGAGAGLRRMNCRVADQVQARPGQLKVCRRHAFSRCRIPPRFFACCDFANKTVGHDDDDDDEGGSVGLCTVPYCISPGQLRRCGPALFEGRSGDSGLRDCNMREI